MTGDLEITAGIVVVRGAISTDGPTNAYYIGQRQVATVNTLEINLLTIFLAIAVTALDQVETDSDLSTTPFEVSYTPANASVHVEIDTVESASPYIFNVSMIHIWYL